MTPRRLRAPRGDRAVLAEPPPDRVGDLLARNRQRLCQSPGALLGRPLEDLRRQARLSAWSAARDYLRQAGEPVPAGGADSLLLAGHQPELFHPGVWVKNFALNGLARRHGATPLNLVVDNDQARALGLRVPVSSRPLECAAFREHPAVRVALLAYDRGPADAPYEERAVHDEALFADFPRRVAEAARGWGFEPLLPDFWAEVLRQAGRTPLLGERFAAARRAWERAWGCHNLEVPVSALCRTEPFAWFACHLLAHAGPFHAAYNACVHEYRRLNGIRSHNHPVPDLAAEGDWRELPFWAWRSGQKRRARLFVRPTASAVELRAGAEPWPALPAPREGDVGPLVAAWQALEAGGFKVRSRALTNTLYARLLVGDLFIHGIGGGKYDEVTDALMRRFYGIEPPDFLVLSATLLLPLPSFPAGPDDVRRLAREVRDLEWNPQRHLDAAPVLRDGADARELAAEKERWVRRAAGDRRARRERYRVLRDLTDRLRPFLAAPIEGRRRELACRKEQVQANEVLRRRDYAFCLYPEGLLREFCTQFLDPNRFRSG